MNESIRTKVLIIILPRCFHQRVLFLSDSSHRCAKRSPFLFSALTTCERSRYPPIKSSTPGSSLASIKPCLQRLSTASLLSPLKLMSSPEKSPPSDLASPAPISLRRFIWYQIVFLVRLCLICLVTFFLLAVLNAVILNARLSIECPNEFQPPAADDATWPWNPTFPDETSRDMFYRTTNLTTFLAEDVHGTVLLSQSLKTLSKNRTLLAVEEAITDIERLSDEVVSSDQDSLGDLLDAWHRLGIDARDLFSHIVALHSTSFYMMRSFALQLRHIDLALDKIRKSWSTWDWVELHMQMTTSCSILNDQLALLNEELDKIHTVVNTSRIDASEIEKVIQDMHTSLILSYDEGQDLESSHKIWYTLDNLTVVNLDFMFVVDSLDRDLMSIERPIPLGICNEVNLTLLEDGDVQHPSTYYGSKETLQGYMETLEDYGDFDAVQRNDVWAINLLADHTLNDLTRAVEAWKMKVLEEESQEFEVE
ncbi:hypothetical protein IW261DRAFT_1488278 [Armillaria novae-zelandiae]|uniref:Uncharacterized protein n=1 Tax=Armillaria novae-zelandiae TaxID=153914 RepID=A0AA39U8K8_9AGAR|nr:hypothetical protein IW261DRAFT_1488278 [Armillaria novae-zelandiae]